MRSNTAPLAKSVCMGSDLFSVLPFCGWYVKFSFMYSDLNPHRAFLNPLKGAVHWTSPHWKADFASDDVLVKN